MSCENSLTDVFVFTFQFIRTTLREYSITMVIMGKKVLWSIRTFYLLLVHYIVTMTVNILYNNNTIYYYSVERLYLFYKCIHFLEKLPSLTTLYDEIFKREPDQFTPDTRHRNILFQTFYQYFILQFLNNDFELTVCVYCIIHNSIMLFS